MELITKEDFYFERQYYNELTAELDTYILDKLKPYIKYGGGTYLDGYPSNGRMSIRYPGATRGGISFDENGIITEIRMLDDDMARSVQCYKPEAYEVVKKYLGAKLIFQNHDNKLSDKNTVAKLIKFTSMTENTVRYPQVTEDEISMLRLSGDVVINAEIIGLDDMNKNTETYPYLTKEGINLLTRMSRNVTPVVDMELQECDKFSMNRPYIPKEQIEILSKMTTTITPVIENAIHRAMSLDIKHNIEGADEMAYKFTDVGSGSIVSPTVIPANKPTKRDYYKTTCDSIKSDLIEKSLSEKEAAYVLNKIRRAIRQAGNVNNFRIMVNDNGILEYDNKVRRGCCGSYDIKITLYSGKTVRFGFNYGH